MKSAAFWLGFVNFVAALVVDAWIFSNGSYALGILVCVGTVLVFAAGIVWLVYHDDPKLHLRRPWLIVPIAAFGTGIVMLLQNVGMAFVPAPENMLDIGNMVVTRFQIGLWLVSFILLLGFVMAGSLMARKRA